MIHGVSSVKYHLIVPTVKHRGVIGNVLYMRGDECITPYNFKHNRRKFHDVLLLNMKPIFKSIRHFVCCQSQYHKIGRVLHDYPERVELVNVFYNLFRNSIRGYKRSHPPFPK